MSRQSRKSTAHAKKRALERYGISDLDIKTVRWQYREGIARVFDREPRARVVKMFCVIGKLDTPVIYNEKRQVVITVLPPDAPEVIRARAKEAEAAT